MDLMRSHSSAVKLLSSTKFTEEPGARHLPVAFGRALVAAKPLADLREAEAAKCPHLNHRRHSRVKPLKLGQAVVQIEILDILFHRRRVGVIYRNPHEMASMHCRSMAARVID